jgi:hypothetical protein
MIGRQKKTLIHRPVCSGVNKIRLDYARLSHDNHIDRLNAVFPKK